MKVVNLFLNYTKSQLTRQYKKKIKIFEGNQHGNDKTLF